MKVKSKKPNKQRKALYKYKNHQRSKLLTCRLADFLREEFGIKKIPLRVGDSVRVCSGEFLDFEGEVLEKVFEKKGIELNGDDVLFDPKAEKYFILSSSLKDQTIFKETWDGSDLPNMIGRFADSTYHRYLHLDKHLEKTERKIRN